MWQLEDGLPNNSQQEESQLDNLIQQYHKLSHELFHQGMPKTGILPKPRPHAESQSLHPVTMAKPPGDHGEKKG
jgi:hypothetical protein